MKIRLVALALAAAVVVAPQTSSGQDSTSAARARTLVQLLEKAGLTAFAVKVTPDGNEYVWVLHVPGAQLLVIRSKHPVPSALDARIAAKDFSGAYGDHNGSTIREGKLFVMDLAADGLAFRPGRNQPYDIAYEDGVTEARFDGDWRDQKMSERDYRAKYTATDTRYAEMLESAHRGPEGHDRRLAGSLTAGSIGRLTRSPTPTRAGRSPGRPRRRTRAWPGRGHPRSRPSRASARP